MNTSETDIYLSSIIKNILFILAFWIGDYFVLTSVYKTINEWTFERIFSSIGVTTVLAITLIIFLFIQSSGAGILNSVIFTVVCLFILAYLGDKAVATFHITYNTAWQALSIGGIIINIYAIIKLIRNIRYYRLIRYEEEN